MSNQISDLPAAHLISGIGVLRGELNPHLSIEQSPEDILSHGVQGFTAPSAEELRTSAALIARWQERQIELVTIWDPRYPPLLLTVPRPPLVLWMRGTLPDGPMVSVVGSRSATLLGMQLATDLGSQLAAAGNVVVSGLALGIDGAAHRGALTPPSGVTIAILGSGLDHLYPGVHKPLAHEIIARRGALLSPFPPEMGPRPHQFLQRNQIIAGLSLVTVVVQAALRSGALSTARAALDLGRDVGAVPGGVNERLHAGCHELIRDGATLIRDAADVVALNGAVRAVAPQATSAPPRSPLLERVLATIQTTPRHLNEVQRMLGVEFGELFVAIMEGEEQGLLLRDREDLLTVRRKGSGG